MCPKRKAKGEEHWQSTGGNQRLALRYRLDLLQELLPGELHPLRLRVLLLACDCV